MRNSVFGLVASLLAGCAINAPTEGQQSAAIQIVPRASGEFRGHYVVPAPAALASAAQFYVAKVKWTISSGIATLTYDLPLGLVGGHLSISLSGSIPPGATTVHLWSPNGTGTCTAAATKIRCSEWLDNLGSLPISETVVEERAAVEYDGPISDRTAVAAFFSSDPIGSVEFDISLRAPREAENEDDSDSDSDNDGGGSR